MPNTSHTYSVVVHIKHTLPSRNVSLVPSRVWCHPTGMVARALLLLACDDGTGEVGHTFSRLAELIDTPVWKFWIPQLLTSFSRPEAKFVHNILVRLAKYNPQVRVLPSRVHLAFFFAVLKRFVC